MSYSNDQIFIWTLNSIQYFKFGPHLILEIPIYAFLHLSYRCRSACVQSELQDQPAISGCDATDSFPK